VEIPSASGMRLRRGDHLPSITAEADTAITRRTAQRAERVETPGLAPRFGSGSPLWAEALGANVLDVDGNRYIDLTAGFGVAAVGHRHPVVVEALRRQSGVLIHGLGDAQGHELRVQLAEALCAVSPIEDSRVAFAVSGADAVELSVKTAMLSTGRSRILAFAPSYHGMSLGALSLSSRRHFRRDFAEHIHQQVTRLPFGCPTSQLEESLSGARFAAAVVEPIVGREGVLVPPAGWLLKLAQLCRRHGALLIADEIFTGFGRTGHWFAVQGEDVEPDLLCCGKALGGGIPIAAVLGRRSVMAGWDAPGEARHTATFVAQPLACAAALATLGVLHSKNLVARAANLGRGFATQLLDWPKRVPEVRDVRGRGALWGIEWTTSAEAQAFVARARRRGLLLLAGGESGRVVQLVPPLVLTDRQLAFCLETLTAVAVK